MRYDLVIQAQRAILPGGETSSGIAVLHGRIVGIHELDTELTAARTIPLGPDEGPAARPGRHPRPRQRSRSYTEREGFGSATRAAAAGGVTTIIDMPLNSLPPTVDVAALDIKRKAAQDNCFVVDPAKLHHKNAVTPYAGRTLAGRVRRTVLRGVDISADVETKGDRHGRLLRRGEA